MFLKNKLSKLYAVDTYFHWCNIERSNERMKIGISQLNEWSCAFRVEIKIKFTKFVYNMLEYNGNN